MHHPVVDTATGTILLNDGYSLHPDKNEEGVTAHFAILVQFPQE